MQLFEGRGVAAVESRKLILVDGSVEPFDEVLWCTQAAAPAWLSDTGLPLGQACSTLSHLSTLMGFDRVLNHSSDD